jgi:uncharacterized protein (DUF488 family)
MSMSDGDRPTLFTIGHSNHAFDTFRELLARHGIAVVVDVRSMPYSRYVPHFNPAPLRAALTAAGVDYVYLGRELGARPDDPTCYVDGRVSYARLAARPEYQAGLERVTRSVTERRLALMCTEKDPLDCHRMIRICRDLRSMGIDLVHILADGTLELNATAEARLRDRFGLQPTLFDDEAAIIEQAYDRQAARIAHRQPPASGARDAPEDDPA